MLIKAAINGSRTREEHPRVPLTPREQAAESAAAVAAGAGAIHVHARAADGGESLSPDDVARCLESVRAACPGIPVGVSTGAWIVSDIRERLRLIEAWDVLPDFASVNFHEEGAARVAGLLTAKGVGVEAGVWNVGAAEALLRSGLAAECLRVLIEPAEGAADFAANLEQIEAALGSVRAPRLLHGLDESAWELVALAGRRGYDTRAGFEDTLRLPGGALAQGNAELVAAASAIARGALTL